jgi:aldehyde:ferredoxin oxidoreductase
MENPSFNRYLEVNLDDKSFKSGQIDPETLRKFVGGKGVGLSLLTKMDTSSDALDAQNPLIFATGPLTGTIIQTSARSVVVTRSPLTGNFLDSNAGGHFGPALRRAGWDYVSILGASQYPVYLLITPQGVEFRDASDLWGKDIFETETILKKRHPGSRVASIGPAGENLVRFACIGTELYRQFGRGGAGAVMGSKKLKALVVQGNEKISYASWEEFQKLAREIVEELKVHPNAQRRYELGTTMWVRMGQEIGHFLPTKNYQRGQFEHYEKITAETMKQELNWESVGCYGCAIIRCAKHARWNGFEIEGPEYETTAFLGSNCCLSSAKDVAYANWLCDRYGLDTISCGVTISFALECAERALLSSEDNSRLKFGSAPAVHSLIEEIAFRKGLGDILAEGTRRAAKIIGKGSDYFAIHIGGMEISGVNILGCYSMGLNLATADFGSHTRFWSATDEMNGNLKLENLPLYIKNGQDEINVRNSMIICDFFPFDLNRLAPFMEAVTGFGYTPAELLEVGERIQSLSRLYNLRTGRTHADDTLPPRFFEEESFAGLMEGRKINKEFFESQVQEIFKLRGWDSEGRPKSETLQRLGIERF